MDITQLIPADRQVIERYGNGGFRVSGVAWTGNILVTPRATTAWSLANAVDLAAESFAALFGTGVEVLLIGGGRSTPFVPPAVRADLKAHGLVAEPMDTGAACRTYNILLSEGRAVAAALIAV
jgi:uncharacterized protein